MASPFSSPSFNIGIKKRTASDVAPQSPALKRRKASNISAASFSAVSHPLRQTSFPPEDASTPFSARSPSVDFDNASLVSGGPSSVAGGTAATTTKKKRGRKSKADKLREQTPSVVGAGGGQGATAASAVSGTSGANGGGPKSSTGAPGDGTAAAGGDDDNDGGDGGDGDMPDSGAATAKRTDEERKEEKRLRAALVACMDSDQYERISAWRAAKLPDAVIRRLVNATVSQSVPSSVVTAVRSVTKYFLTDLITRAQTVQDEWIAAGHEPQTDDGRPWPGMVLARGEPEVAALYEKQASLAIPEWEPESADHILREPPKGPLRPDHLREAWRRYKVSVQSKTAGALDLWHAQQGTGVERFPARTGGKRLFK
ncbi:hypothetical protein HMPREF1624_02573 [Sporothrix schenckii ATCC 58251]|uniref:TAFII28-like protein domain-containing protein n=1 Tax=Sporothrix schenckii (strain ATCC 58251 / de Perez 2211183) TaxID=1391915 RepID=U7Q091_SPOS1|nr:hypothetical protein HMPREF1624_02573 [Sporothrix schenckii ATCC 58251]